MTASQIWRNSYPVVIANSHGFSRTIPAVVGDCVVTLGPKCQLACWDAATGKSRWLIHLVLEHGATVPSWYAEQRPFIDTDQRSGLSSPPAVPPG